MTKNCGIQLVKRVITEPFREFKLKSGAISANLEEITCRYGIPGLLIIISSLVLAFSDGYTSYNYKMEDPCDEIEHEMLLEGGQFLGYKFALDLLCSCVLCIAIDFWYHCNKIPSKPAPIASRTLRTRRVFRGLRPVTTESRRI